MKVYGGRGVITPHIILSTWQMWVVRLMPWLLYRWYSMDNWLGGVHGPSACFVAQKKVPARNWITQESLTLQQHCCSCTDSPTKPVRTGMTVFFPHGSCTSQILRNLSIALTIMAESFLFKRSWDSVVGIVTRYGLEGPGIETRWGEIFRTYPDRLRVPPSLLYNGYWVFPGGKGGRGVMLTTHPF
jgi:hypothetical protein